MSREISEDGVVDAAASTAFWLLLSMPAAALAVLASVSFLDPSLTRELEDALLDFVDETFTTEGDPLREAIRGVFDSSRPGLLSVSVLIAVFTLSRGFAGLIRALDVVYDVEESRNLVHVRLTAIGLALGTLVTVAASTFLWAFAGRLDVPGIVRAAGALAVLIVWAATVFHIGPNHHTPWRYDLPGALLAAFGWLIVSFGFGWYVRFGGSGNEIVGAAGTLLLGLTWLWAVCVVLLIGGELNEILARRAGVVSENTIWRERISELVSDLRETLDEDAPADDEPAPGEAADRPDGRGTRTVTEGGRPDDPAVRRQDDRGASP
jgi:membrane protein